MPFGSTETNLSRSREYEFDDLGYAVSKTSLVKLIERTDCTLRATYLSSLHGLIRCDLRVLVLPASGTGKGRCLDKDRAAVAQEQERDRVEQNKRFSEIAGGITEAIEESQKQFQTTMARSDRMVNLERSAITQVGESIKTQTGGDSFCFVSFTPQESQRAFTVTVTNHGKYPLRGVHLTMSDEEKERRLQIESLRNPDDFLRNIHAAETYFQIPFLLAGDVKMLGMYPFTENDRQDFDVGFGGENGLWVERIRLRRVNGKWVEAIRVLGPTTEQAQHPFEQFDPEYPKGTGKFDWFH